MIFGLLLACFSAIPPYLENPMENPHSDCPVGDSVVSVGFSPNSPSEAQENARRRVVEQIISQIQTQQISQRETQQIAHKEYSYAQLTQNVVVQSAFAYFDLVRDVGVVHHYKDGYRALSCMTISSAENRIMQEIQSDWMSLQQMFTDALQTKNIAEFSLKRQRILQTLPQWKEPLLLLYGLRNSPSVWEMQLNGQLQALENRSAEFRKYTVVLFSASTENPLFQNYANTIIDTIQQHLVTGAMSVSSSKAKWSDKACTTNTDVLLHTYMTSNDAPGPMGGFVVKSQLIGEWYFCDSGQSQQTVFTESQGYNSRELVKAQEDAVQNLRTQNIDVLQVGQPFFVLLPLAL